MPTIQNITRILIADDHEMIRVGLRSILSERADWSIVGEAVDGEGAVLLASQTEPHVAILDYELPLRNGLEVTRQIRARLPGTQVLMFTMHDTPIFVAKAFEVGASAFVTKSEASSHLPLAVEALITRRPYVSERTGAKLAQSFLTGLDRMEWLTPGARIARRLMSDGHPDHEIAKALKISPATVENFRSRLTG